MIAFLLAPVRKPPIMSEEKEAGFSSLAWRFLLKRAVNSESIELSATAPGAACWEAYDSIAVSIYYSPSISINYIINQI